MPDDDHALIQAAQNGEAQAFEALLTQRYQQIYRFAFRWAGDRADAEDITQQACIKVANTLSSFRFEAAFSTWLYRLVINCAKDWLKSQRRHDHDLTSHNDMENALTLTSPAEQQVHLNQTLMEIAALGEGMKETVILVLSEGLTHKEAADILKVEESTVSWRIHQVRKHMRGKHDPR